MTNWIFDLASHYGIWASLELVGVSDPLALASWEAGPIGLTLCLAVALFLEELLPCFHNGFIWPSLLWCTAICILDIIRKGKRGSEGVCPAGRLHPIWGRQASLCGSAQRWASSDKCCWQMAPETRLSQLREVWSWRTGPHPVTTILWTSSV